MSGNAGMDQKVAQLLAIVPSMDPGTAQFLLESTNGDVQQALSLFEDNLAGPPVRQQQQQQHGAAAGLQRGGDPPPRPRPPVSAPTHPQRALLGLRGLAWRLLQVPSVVLSTGLGLAFTGITLGFGVAAVVGDRILPARVMTGLRGAIHTLTSPPEDLDPPAQARKFIQAFKSAYGDRHPRFVESAFRQAVTQAKNEFKFALVYLHSSEHQDTDRFCADVLCAPEMVSYANQNFVAWGGDVRYADAFQLSSRLAVTSFPYVALLNTTPGNQVQLVAHVQGYTPVPVLMAKLAQAVERHGAMLVAQRAEVQEREFARRLREEQNEEYERSLAADREREARREQQRQQEEQEQREREEAEARVRAEAEAEERRKQELAQSIARRREDKRASLPAEPEPSVPGTALVRLRLPDGGSSQRRFMATHRMHHLFDFVDSLDSTNYLRYTLVSTYPVKVFNREQADLTLEDAGLAPQAALFVRPEEEEAAAAVHS